MTVRCSTPIAWESLVDYWSDELDAADTDRIDEHLIGCDACTAASARMETLRDAVSAMIPPFISRAEMVALRARGLRVAENVVDAGERRTAVFPAETDLLVHRLHGLYLSRVESARVTITIEETGQVILDEPSVPFDRESGEILVGCQRHFGAFPRTVVFEVHAREPSGVVTVARYPILHRLEESRDDAGRTS